MARRLVFSILLLFLSVETSLAVRPEPLPRGARLDPHLEFLEGGEAILTLKIVIPVSNIVFRREKGLYRSSLRTAVTLRDRESGRETSRIFHEELSRETFADARHPKALFETEYTMELSSGDFDVEVLIYGRGPYLPWRESFPLELPSPESRTFFIQGPAFDTLRPEPETPPFGFFDPWNIPPRRSLFLDGFSGPLGLSAELRVWEAADSLEVILSLEQRDGRIVHYERRLLSGDPGDHSLRWILPVEDLSMGPHKVTVSVLREGERQSIQGKLEMGFGPPAFGRDWSQTLQLLSLIADPDEIELMDSAEPDRRHAVFLEFWARHDSDRGLGNPAMESFFRNLDYIGHNFGTAWMPGWRSDRGRIYLEYGPPQQVNQVDEEAGFLRREIWAYADGRVFIFEDRHGQGDYELVDRWSR